ncbi:signal peptidase 12 kDa subunit [Planoprotostelium fungivorum]|uniref:Signal peptidase complex subunit 1 n=1 Tax=Planoprotostelium fungivorum TaxID=1890364 RepID=A0A2P6NMX7_9EUKA|nr:signal peptidase 12 kDa subunit [Planoprotostelium fungivorum]
MDLKGQKLAERMYQIIIGVFAAVGWIIGFVIQDFFFTMVMFVVGCLLATILTVPEWGYLNRNPHKWLPKIQDPVITEIKK